MFQGITTGKVKALMTTTAHPKDGDKAEKDFTSSDTFPKLNCKVFMVGSCFISGAIALFAKAGCTRAETVEDAGLLVFLGGEDVNPALYGEPALRSTYYSADRDEREKAIYEKALELKKPMFGICRGFQLLNVLQGGKLYQDVQNHGSEHYITDTSTHKSILASSMHHQMVIEDDNIFVIAYATQDGLGGEYVSHHKATTWNRHKDVEAGAWLHIKALGVQGHPEVGGYPEFSAWCIQLIKDFIYEFEIMEEKIVKPIIGHNSSKGVTGEIKVKETPSLPVVTVPRTRRSRKIRKGVT